LADAGAHPFAALVSGRGGAVLVERGAPVPQGAGFAALLRHGEEIWPPLARITTSPIQTFLITAGFVGGSEGEGSREITAELVSRVLDAALAGEVSWEVDPDFGWELPMEVPGTSWEEHLVLVPVHLYARTDRPYEYAAKVPVAQGKQQ
jgi:ATP-dependent phosphoenolpyruvate carboxykinase